jgi:low affinity Fe/Cu permease
MIRHAFETFAKSTSRFAGHPVSFALALGIVAVWGVLGPIYRYSDTWQLVINTGTTIVTFLMVFLIQNSQNRDGAAVQAKLDELIRAVAGANNEMINLEDLSEEELEACHERYARLADQARSHLNGMRSSDVSDKSPPRPGDGAPGSQGQSAAAGVAGG